MTALNNYMEHNYTGKAFWYNNCFHNNPPELGDFFEVEIDDGILIDALSYPQPETSRYQPYTEGCKYPVHVEI
jgi:hypothetical protein